MIPVKMSALAMPPIVQGTPADYPLTRPYAPYMSPISNYTYGADEGEGEDKSFMETLFRASDARVFGVKGIHIAYGVAILAVAYGAYRYMK
jgi:hypothetical protein